MSVAFVPKTFSVSYSSPALNMSFVLKSGISVFSSLSCQSLLLSCSQSLRSGVSLFSSLSCQPLLPSCSQSLQCGLPLLNALIGASSSVPLSMLTQPPFLFIHHFSSTASPFSFSPTPKPLFSLRRAWGCFWRRTSQLSRVAGTISTLITKVDRMFNIQACSQRVLVERARGPRKVDRCKIGTASDLRYDVGKNCAA